MKFAGLLLEAFQLLLGVLQLPGGAFQLPGQLLVGEFQLGILCSGFMLVIMQGCALALQLERNGGQRNGGQAPSSGWPQLAFSTWWAGTLTVPLTALKLCPVPSFTRMHFRKQEELPEQSHLSLFSIGL